MLPGPCDVIEIRLLEGPNVYRLEPVVKIEVALGRRRTWYGQRSPGRHALVRLGADVPAREWPLPIESLVSWIRRLRVDHGEGQGGVVGPSLVGSRALDRHVPVDGRGAGPHDRRGGARPGRARRLARPPGASDRLQERMLARWSARIAEARATPPAWIRDADRRMPVVSITGTNGKSTVTRLVTHILKVAGRRVGTTTSDGVLVDERMVEPGDWTGPGGAWQILGRSDVDVGVLETARGGLVLRGMGYESNDASVITNVSSDHLDLQGIHTLPELAEVKSTVARATRPGGWAVLNADDPLVAAVARRLRANVAMFSTRCGRGASRPSGGRWRRAGAGYVLRDGWLVEIDGSHGSDHDGGRRADRDGHDGRGARVVRNRSSTRSSRSTASRSPSAGSPATTWRTPSPPRVPRAGSASRSPSCATASPTSSPRPSARLAG